MNEQISNEEMGIAARLPGVQSAIDQLLNYKQGLLDQLAAIRGRTSTTDQAIAVLTGTKAANPEYFMWEPVVTKALSAGPMSRAMLWHALEPQLPVERRDRIHLGSALARLTKSGVLIKNGTLFSVNPKRRENPHVAAGRASAGYWAKMTPEQRSAEIKRRRANITHAKLHPRDPRHPEHEAWVEKMREVNRKRWASMSKAERKRRSDAMVAGRAKKQTVNGRAVSA